jgi:hypothetical protein
MSIRGRTSRDKFIIDVLIFCNGHVLHHPPTIPHFFMVVKFEDYQRKGVTPRLTGRAVRAVLCGAACYAVMQFLL